MALLMKTLQHHRSIRVTSVMLLLLMLLSLCLTGCSDSNAQQLAQKSKSDLDQQIAHARSIGIPDSALQSVLDQEKKLSQTTEPSSLFSSQPSTDYYTNLKQRYHTLALEVKGLNDQAVQIFGYQASKDLQDFQDMVSQRQGEGYREAATFAPILQDTQQKMSQAQTPKDFVQVSATATDGAEALRLLATASDKLDTLQTVLKQLEASKVDTGTLDQQSQDTLDLIRDGKTAADYQMAIAQLDADLQSTTTISTQAIPYVGASKLKELSDDIDTMKKYNVDTSSYEKHLSDDKSALNNASTLADYMNFSTQIDQDLASVQVPMLQGQAKFLTQQFHDEVQNWGKANMWNDPYDGKDYMLDYPYDLPGIGGELDTALNQAQTPDDYQNVVTLATHDMTNLKAMEANYKDTTSWDQPHDTDKQLLDYYKVTSGKAIVVSLVENTVRVYQDGNMIKAIQVVTGRPELPSPPGFMYILSKEKDVTFKSYEPPGSAFWYPDTPIHFALGYRVDGYFFHDSTWRGVYGGHDSLPHHDPIAGDSQWTVDGSHGCINMALDDVSWMNDNIDYNTPVILY
jgi:hypothetical protein